MNPIVTKRLRDALEASNSILAWTQGVTFERYLADGLLRSAIERQIGIVGEALNVARRADLGIADHVPDLHGWISMRNFVIHIYDRVDHRIVWDSIADNVPELIATLERLLAEDSSRG